MRQTVSCYRIASTFSARGIPVPKKRVLFLASDPSNAARLRLGEEHREVSIALQMGRERNLKLEERFAVRVGDLTQAIHDFRPQIIHFSGHGTRDGELCFENNSGTSYPVPPEALTQLFSIVSGEVECVILNACYSRAQAEAISAHVPFVIGMSKAIGDRAAITFAVGLYKAIAGGRDYEAAFQYGTVELQLEDIPENETPILLRCQPRAVSAESIKNGQSGYIPVVPGRFVEASEDVESLETLFVDPLKYRSVGELTDDLYSIQLHRQVAPFTYGREWVLGIDNAIYLAPLPWSQRQGTNIREFDEGWLRETDLSIFTGVGRYRTTLQIVFPPFPSARLCGPLFAGEVRRLANRSYSIKNWSHFKELSLAALRDEHSGVRLDYLVAVSGSPGEFGIYIPPIITRRTAPAVRRILLGGNVPPHPSGTKRP